jgi:NADH:ubiquinone oxidoreductase subunit
MNKPTKLTRTHIKEVYIFEYDGTYYETTIDATEQRKRILTLKINDNAMATVPEEVYEYIDHEIAQIDE